jgi:hypothetical protein
LQVLPSKRQHKVFIFEFHGFAQSKRLVAVYYNRLSQCTQLDGVAGSGTKKPLFEYKASMPLE